MPRYEYKVIPAPQKGIKVKGVKGAEARFAHALQERINDLAEAGWEYQRAETLPSVERAGLTSSVTEWRNLLIFRRRREDDLDAFAPELLPAPTEAEAEAEPKMAARAEDRPPVTAPPPETAEDVAAKPG